MTILICLCIRVLWINIMLKCHIRLNFHHSFTKYIVSKMHNSYTCYTWIWIAINEKIIIPGYDDNFAKFCFTFSMGSFNDRHSATFFFYYALSRMILEGRISSNPLPINGLTLFFINSIKILSFIFVIYSQLHGIRYPIPTNS